MKSSVRFSLLPTPGDGSETSTSHEINEKTSTLEFKQAFDSPPSAWRHIILTAPTDRPRQWDETRTESERAYFITSPLKATNSLRGGGGGWRCRWRWGECPVAPAIPMPRHRIIFFELSGRSADAQSFWDNCYFPSSVSSTCLSDFLSSRFQVGLQLMELEHYLHRLCHLSAKLFFVGKIRWDAASRLQKHPPPQQGWGALLSLFRLITSCNVEMRFSHVFGTLSSTPCWFPNPHQPPRYSLSITAREQSVSIPYVAWGFTKSTLLLWFICSSWWIRMEMRNNGTLQYSMANSSRSNTCKTQYLMVDGTSVSGEMFGCISKDSMIC